MVSVTLLSVFLKKSVKKKASRFFIEFFSTKFILSREEDNTKFYLEAFFPSEDYTSSFEFKSLIEYRLIYKSEESCLFRVTNADFINIIFDLI